MAGRVRSQHQGVGKVTRRESFTVSHMVQQRLATGASSQGFGPHATQVMVIESLDTLEEELDNMQVDKLCTYSLIWTSILILLHCAPDNLQS